MSNCVKHAVTTERTIDLAKSASLLLKVAFRESKIAVNEIVKNASIL